MPISLSKSVPNLDEIAFWNGPQGRNWVKQNFLTDRMYDPFGLRALAAAKLQPGDRVIDIGCGCGKTTIALAEAVGRKGRVTSVDPSAPMLDVARARLAGYAETVELVCDDAATYRFEPADHDALFSQFGLMFFDDPPAAFRNLGVALRAGGRLSFVSWRRPEFNPWLMIVFEAVQAFVPEMQVPSPQAIASPFSLSIETDVASLLSDAGFTDIHMEIYDESICMGQGSYENCLDFVADFSNPVATALRKNLPERAPEILAAVSDAIAPYYTGETIALPASAWIVTAKRAQTHPI